LAACAARRSSKPGTKKRRGAAEATPAEEMRRPVLRVKVRGAGTIVTVVYVVVLGDLRVFWSVLGWNEDVVVLVLMKCRQNRSVLMKEGEEVSHESEGNEEVQIHSYLLTLHTLGFLLLCTLLFTLLHLRRFRTIT
jgi:hypothetical protein